MTSWELAAKAIQTGIKIRHLEWPDDEFIFYSSERKKWIDTTCGVVAPSFESYDNWEEYKEPVDKYLYEYAYQNTTSNSVIISAGLSTIKKIEGMGYFRFKLLRKFDPDTLEIIEDQNAKD